MPVTAMIIMAILFVVCFILGIITSIAGMRRSTGIKKVPFVVSLILVLLPMILTAGLFLSEIVYKALHRIGFSADYLFKDRWNTFTPCSFIPTEL